ncbi:DNA-directed primase/polymerase protein isoform X1 [Senna tora]|uniref:DNA-directed primase/polymerase protein n=1 Tax=Senna tora TaxID=362788 RepID=A0A834SF05_9FABA|nr:DNA-directed primase/polymerase protein isoform X1 [Senna tora]
MDDVDRLFACFKCGVSPPQSAMRERKRTKSRLDQGSSILEISSRSSLLSPKLVGQEQKNHAICTSSPSGQAIDLKSTIAKAKGLSGGKQISPVVFYGSPNGVPPKKPVRLWRLLHEIRLDLSEQNKLNSREEVWVTFPRQDDAMKFAKGQEHVRIFSYQDHFSGQRRFLVSTYTEFWRRYKNMDAKLRHHYEVIQEGLPCHLYFDLEFNKRANIGKDGDEMMDLLISVILEALNEKYLICGDQEWIVELDSSTDEKFSRHLIIRIPKAAFKDNAHAGAFVSEICSRILKAREKDRRFEKLFVMKDSSSDESASQIFVDTAVYSRNRCFRLPLSSKAGKSSVLVPSGRFKCKNLGEEDMFMASLICNMDVDCEKLLVCKKESDCVKSLCYDTEVVLGFEVIAFMKFRLCLSNHWALLLYFGRKNCTTCLDHFLKFVLYIGSISYDCPCYLTNTFGWYAGSVMYAVDLRRAIYYQKCHDPDCRGYRSPLRPIPVEVINNSSVDFNSFGTIDHERPLADDLRHQLLNDNQASKFHLYDDDKADSPGGSWWLEALRVVEDVEHKKKESQLNMQQPQSMPFLTRWSLLYRSSDTNLFCLYSFPWLDATPTFSIMQSFPILSFLV